MGKVKILGMDSKCEACGSLEDVKSIQLGVLAVSLCNTCRVNLLDVITADLLCESKDAGVEARPVCNFCGRKGYAGEGTHTVHGYEILNSCHKCERDILNDDEEEV